jgi:hypothetical protein
LDRKFVSAMAAPSSGSHASWCIVAEGEPLRDVVAIGKAPNTCHDIRLRRVK